MRAGALIVAFACVVLAIFCGLTGVSLASHGRFAFAAFEAVLAAINVRLATVNVNTFLRLSR